MPITCPTCGGISPESAPACDCGHEFAPTVRETRRCPFCAEEILAEARKCRHCGEFLDGTRPPVAAQGEAIGTALLLIPLASVFLIWFWIGQMNLLQSPGSTLAAAACLTVIVTAGLAATEAGRIKTRTSPVAWFVAFLFLWVIAYPAYLFVRRKHGRKNLIVGGLVVAVAFAGSVIAVSAAIESQKQKVKDVFDSASSGLGGLSGSSGASPKPLSVTQPATRNEKTGKWRLNASTSSFDDSKTVVLALEAESAIVGWPAVTHTPTLILRCKENKTEAYVNAGMQGKPVFGEYGQDLGVSMRGRYDKGETFEYEMPKSTDGQAFFFRYPIEEIKYMTKHSSLVLEFTPFNSNPVEIRFDLTGLSEVLKPVRDACSW